MEKKNFKLEISTNAIVNFNVVTVKGKEEKKEWFDELVPEFSKNAETSWDIRKKESINVIKTEYPATGDIEFNICIDTEQVNINAEDEKNVRNYIFFRLAADLAITTLLQFLSTEDKDSIKLSEIQNKMIGNSTISDNISMIQLGIFQNLLENI